jgi:hypothetical protein
MSFRPWRRVRIAPGLRVNVSRSGLSASFGARGAWFTTGRRGKRVTLGAPGTRPFLTQHYPAAKSASSIGIRPDWIVAAVVVGLVVLLALFGSH